MTVLLVEDNPDDADLLQTFLADAGIAYFTIVHCETLRDGLQRLDAGGIDLVLLDLSLPDSEGEQTVTRTLAHPAGVPVVVLTGLDDERLGMDAVQAGAQDYLIKGTIDGRGLARCMRYAVERHKLLWEKARLNEELAEANMVKTYFAATMSHELRNTLGVITGLTDLLIGRAPQRLSAQHRKAIQLMNQRSKESLQLIQATLELARSEASAAGSDAEAVNTSEMLLQLATEVTMPPDRMHVSLHWHADPDIPPLHADRVKLKMILRNLATNAIKFTERGGVSVRAGADRTHVRFWVTDTGIGIPADELATIFEPFRQVRALGTRHAGGSGLGLFIVRRLTDLIGGAITVESRVGHGTIFTVSIPLAPPESSPSDGT